MNKLFAFFLVYSFLIKISCLSRQNTNNPSNSYKEFRKSLLKDYDKKIRPGAPDRPLNITVDIQVMFVEEIQGSKGIAIFNVVVATTWIDENIRWDWDPGTSNSNLECIFLEYSELYVPATRFMDNMIWIKYRMGPGSPDFPVYVCHNGTVAMQHSSEVSLFVKIDEREFPFDEQDLEFNYGHTSAGIMEVDVTLGKVSLYEHTGSNVEWAITKLNCERQTQNYSQPQYSVYPFINCHLFTVRNSGYYIISFYVPTLAVVLMHLLDIHCVAFIPSAERVTKFQLAMMTFMSMSLMTLNTMSLMPRSSGLSRLHIYYFIVMLVIFCSSLNAGLTKNMFASKNSNKTAAKMYEIGSGLVFLSAIAAGSAWLMH